MQIKESHFRGVDLNLLVTLSVLLRERSVSRAAEHLHLGQPAVSGALARLRELFDDPLLVRSTHGMAPTARALELERRLLPALAEIEAALLQRREFDPLASDRTFVIGMPDWIELWLAPPLLACLAVHAPRVRLAIVPTDPFRGTDMLERGEMDLGVGPFAKGPAWRRERDVRSMGFRCVYGAAPLQDGGRLSLADYLRFPHVLVSYRGGFDSAADAWLATQGHAREVRYSSARFASVPAILHGIAALATVPAVLADQWCASAGLRQLPSPVPLPDFTVLAAWTTARDSDAGLMWLADRIASLAGAGEGLAT
ncbi:transcriptional regulator [Cupriavidus sp. TA19]|uniref:LysR family transcriptional regulator n=1 Tax=unclassified Cupriavidus TaxID=2640874 RepID=UPI0027294EBF|nr:LysR family transcriptional regulator [Cupriavidus sp. TA19]GLC92751.1 transcriptional regulator [Cupriavidus sp. TA19]